jgi:hypothetical protein
VIQQGFARLIPLQVQGLHVGVWMLVAQVTHGRGDDKARRVADGDPAGLGGGPGRGRGLGGRAQQRPGAGQEDLARLGEPGTLRGPVEQAGAELGFEVADLPAQRRLRHAQGGGGPAEMAVLGDGGEVPHQAQLEVYRRRRVGHAIYGMRLSRRLRGL